VAARAGVGRGAAEMSVRGIVLAAGAGERMGGPKALLLVEGEPLARVHARRLGEAGCASVTIVTRPELVGPFTRAGEVAVASSAPDPAGSLAVGLAAFGRDLADDDAIVITPVDTWPAQAATVRALLRAIAIGAGVEAVTPRYRGRGGHPVVVRARAFAGFVSAPRPLRDVLAGLGEARARLEVDDPAVGTDLDTPDDFSAAAGVQAHFWLR